MKRVLYVVNDAAFFESHRFPLALEVIARNGTVKLLSPNEPSPQLIRAGVLWESIRLSSRGTSFFEAVSAAWHIYKTVRMFRPDVVHSVAMKPNLLSGLISRFDSRAKWVFAISGLGTLFLVDTVKYRGLRALVRPLFAYSLTGKKSTVIFQNNDDATFFSQWLGVDPCRSVLIRGAGVPLDLFTPRPEPSGPPVVVMVSRLLIDKGVREFINAARVLKGRGIEAKFKLVGSVDRQNPRSVSEEEVVRACKEGLVVWCGFQSNVNDVYAQSHIACLPSYREGLPRSLIEAAACGRPVVTTNVPGCRDAISEGKTGLLCKPRDYIDLADKLAVLISSEVKRREMGRSGRDLAETSFDLRIVIREHMNIYYS